MRFNDAALFGNPLGLSFVAINTGKHVISIFKVYRIRNYNVNYKLKGKKSQNSCIKNSVRIILFNIYKYETI